MGRRDKRRRKKKKQEKRKEIGDAYKRPVVPQPSVEEVPKQWERKTEKLAS